MRIILATLLLCFSLNAASWYVDIDNDGGTEDGTSWATAWGTMPDVVWGAGGVTAGDTLYISGGSTSKTYTNTWTVGASGTSGNPITIKTGQDASHNGTVVFDWDFGDGCDATGISVVNKSYITFDGEVSGASKMLLANLRHQTNRSTAYAIGGYSNTGFICKWLTFSNVNAGVRMHTMPNPVLAYNTLLQIRGDVGLCVQGGTDAWDSQLIYSNNITLAYNDAIAPNSGGPYAGPDGIQNGSGATIFGNVITATWNTNIYTSTQHPDSIQAQGTKLKIYGNEFVNVGDSAIDYDAYAVQEVKDIYVYNNLFRIQEEVDTYPQFIRFYDTGASKTTNFSNIVFANNTFVDGDNAQGLFFYTTATYHPTGTGLQLKNNIFYNTGLNSSSYETFGSVPSTNFTAGTWDISNNIWYHPTAILVKFGGSTYNAATWLASGNDTDSTSSQPTFTSYTLNGSGNDMSLQSGSVGIDAGTSMSSYFTTDITGATRSATWDIGAYEYDSGGGGEPETPSTTGPGTITVQTLTIGL